MHTTGVFARPETRAMPSSIAVCVTVVVVVGNDDVAVAMDTQLGEFAGNEDSVPTAMLHRIPLALRTPNNIAVSLFLSGTDGAHYWRTVCSLLSIRRTAN